MKNHKKHTNGPQKAKFKPGSKKRENKCVVMFDDKARQDYLTGFHKRKLERRKAAVEEIKQKIKSEQSRVREERHKEYMKMLKERTEALADDDDDDDLADVVIRKTESIQYNHPNHTVTVTTISDLDLSGSHLLQPATNNADGQSDDDDDEGKEEEEKMPAMPKKARDPIMNKKIRSLTAALSTFTSKRKRKGKQEGRRGRRTEGRPADTESKQKGGRTTKCQRRRHTGRKTQQQD